MPERAERLEEHNREVIRRIIEELWEQGRLEAAGDLVADAVLTHDPAQREARRGRAAYLRGIQAYRQAFPDLRIAIEDMLAEGDQVVVRWTATGTHGGEFLGIGPTGRGVSFRGISFHRLKNGQLVENWVNWDTLGLLRQLGSQAGLR